MALVTGGSRGLGRAMVVGMARAGADVVIASRKLENCENLAAEVRKATGRRALAWGCHVGRWEEIELLVDAAYGEMGHVDVLVNNAGMSPLYDTPADVTETLWDKVLAVNLKGPFRLTALVGSRMCAGNGGSIINVGSTGALRPRPQTLPYAAAKAGLHALTLGFAHALGPTVRVNTLMPGAFLTDVSRSWDVSELHERQSHYALGRAGQPSEIVGGAIYLASDAASFVTGATLQIDGGLPWT